MLPPEYLPDPTFEPESLMSPALQADSLPLAPPGKPLCKLDEGVPVDSYCNIFICVTKLLTAICQENYVRLQICNVYNIHRTPLYSHMQQSQCQNGKETLLVVNRPGSAPRSGPNLLIPSASCIICLGLDFLTFKM